MSRLRILVLGHDCNPETISVSLVAYSHAAALARLHDVTLAVRAPFEGAVRRAKAPFLAVEAIRMPLLERFYAWMTKAVFKNNFDSQVLTACLYPYSLAFEWRTWRQLRHRIYAGEFDAVLRVTPVTAVMPSPFAFFLRKGPIPFVIGPINGGLPWPPGFEQLEKQKEWISNLRSLYRYFPFARATYRNAAAIIAASSQTFAEFAAYRDKLFFVPENGVSEALCSSAAPGPGQDGVLKLIFVGVLVPRKACDLALRAALPLLRSGRATFSIIGDGPERGRLQELVSTHGIGSAVTFHGWLSHAEVLARLQAADVLVFPSVRDFGGGVVFEALAVGTVPVVVDFGGPGDIVHAGVGYKVALTNESEVVAQIETILTTLAGDRDLLNHLQLEGTAYAQDRLTWDAKAQSTTCVLNWVLRRGPRPELPPPKVLYST
jgi:glycosyltransferase involved in cell wall biosynthesis